MSLLTGIVPATLTMATPLLLAALGENVVQKAGVVNVGLEGMMLVGAFAATLGTLVTGADPTTQNPLIGVVVAALAGLLLALLFAVFAVQVTANQLLVG